MQYLKLQEHMTCNYCNENLYSKSESDFEDIQSDIVRGKTLADFIYKKNICNSICRCYCRSNFIISDI